MSAARKELPPPGGADALRATLADRLNHSAEEAPPVPQGPAQRRAAGKRVATPPPEAVPPLSKALLQRHIFALDAAFGKARAALNDYEGAMEQVVLVVADARRDEVDEDTIDSAAKRKHIQIPGES